MIKSNMQKKLYNLENIEKVITYIPTIFLLLISSFIIIISYAVINTKKTKEIESIKERSVIRYEFKEKEKLYNFVSNIRKCFSKDIAKAKTKLQKVVYKSSGYIQRLGLEGKDFNEIIKYLKNVEKTQSVTFALFRGDTLEIYKGKSLIEYLRELIFGQKDAKKYNRLVLKYIYSQGGDNFQYWIDDVKKTVRVTFFDKIYIQNQLFYIGAFSTINNLRNITKHIIISNIKTNKNDYIWLYDMIDKEVYNFFGHKKIYKAYKIHTHNIKDEKYKILKYYETHENENDRFKNRVYLMDKFKFVTSIEYDKKSAFMQKGNEIVKIKKYYNSFFYKIVIAVVLITLLLIISSILFARFVKDVFARYNRRLYLRKESLQHWKKRFELAIIASNDGMWDIDFVKNSIYFSKKWLEISGYDRNDIKSFGDWFGLIHKEDRDIVQMQFDEILEGRREHLICEYRLKTKNSGYKWILARGKIFISNDKKSYKRMLMMSMDIDKNKRLSKELLNVELLVEDGKITIFKWRNDGKLSVEFVSNSIKNYGYIKGSFETGKLFYEDIIYKEDRIALKNEIDYAIKSFQKSFSKIYRIIDNADQIKWVYSRVLILRDDFGEVDGFYGYIYDITKLKDVQEELKSKVKEEIEKNRQKDAFIIQQNKLASMGGMLGSIAHQWRQPLNNVQLILHFIRDNCGQKKFSQEILRDYIHRAKTQIEYMSQTIDDFRNFYKPSKSKNNFSLEESIKTTLKLVEDQFYNNDIEIELFCKEKIILNSYENELKQSILNILNNAKDAILQRREKENFEAMIDIVIKKVVGSKVKDIIKNFDSKKNFAIISIKNNGGNIDERVIDRIFEPYFTTKFETQGTGIGLYMSKVMIEKNLKGKISVKNIPNGVDFELILPIDESS